MQVWQCSAHHRTTMLHPVVRFLEHEWRLAGGASPAPVALDRVADLCDWFGPACHLPDLVRARNLLAVEPTA
ncbi:MAG TPA: hypothetical protein VG325_05645 [Solirubrobacteraceae bacterium]|nr:hypothetical protein [Solirubrobacteraceae bacterium]